MYMCLAMEGNVDSNCVRLEYSQYEKRGVLEKLLSLWHRPLIVLSIVTRQYKREWSSAAYIFLKQ